jgi:transposase
MGRLELPRFGGHFSNQEKESEMPASKPPYPAEFREQMVELVRAGRGLKQLSREFGVSANAIRNWVQLADGLRAASAAPRSVEATPLSAAEREELIELRRRLKQVQMERDILAKATAWFAGKSERTSTTSSNS